MDQIGIWSWVGRLLFCLIDSTAGDGSAAIGSTYWLHNIWQHRLTSLYTDYAPICNTLYLSNMLKPLKHLRSLQINLALFGSSLGIHVFLPSHGIVTLPCVGATTWGVVPLPSGIRRPRSIFSLGCIFNCNLSTLLF